MNHTHVWQIYDGPYPPPGWAYGDMGARRGRIVQMPVKVSCVNPGCPKDERVQERVMCILGLPTALKFNRWLEELNTEEARRANETPLHELLKEISTW